MPPCLRSLRRELALSLAEAARLSGLSERQVLACERTPARCSRRVLLLRALYSQLLRRRRGA